MPPQERSGIMARTKQRRTYLPYTFPAVAGTHYRPREDRGLSKPRRWVHRATGPRLLRDSPQPAGLEPTTSRSLVERANHYRLSRHPRSYQYRPIKIHVIKPLWSLFGQFPFKIVDRIRRRSSWASCEFMYTPPTPTRRNSSEAAASRENLANRQSKTSKTSCNWTHDIFTRAQHATAIIAPVPIGGMRCFRQSLATCINSSVDASCSPQRRRRRTSTQSSHVSIQRKQNDT